VLSLSVGEIGCVAADDAPAEATSRQVHLVHQLNVWRWLISSLQSRIQAQVCDALSEILLVIFFSGFDFFNRGASLVLVLASEGADTCLMKADVVDQVLDHAVNILVSLRESHLKRVARLGRSDRDAPRAAVVGICGFLLSLASDRCRVSLGAWPGCLDRDF